MKRLIFLITFFAATVAAGFAAPPNLSCEKIFDGRFNAEKNVRISISQNPENYYRCITSCKEPEILRFIEKAYAEDAARGVDFIETRDSNGHFRAVDIENNGEKIRLALMVDPAGETCVLWIKAPAAAFK